MWPVFINEQQMDTILLLKKSQENYRDLQTLWKMCLMTSSLMFEVTRNSRIPVHVAQAAA